MKNYLPSINLRSYFKILLNSLFVIIVLSPFSGYSQVSFTQTSDADFLAGYQENAVISGNNVYLSTAASGINNWLSTTELPQTLAGHQTCTWHSYVYLSGGYNGIELSNAVYRATMQAGGNSAWTAYNILPTNLSMHAMITGHKYIYVIGGKTESGISDKIYFALINADGTLGPWTESSVTLPAGLWGHKAIYQNGFIYVVGGSDQLSTSSALNTVYYAKQTGQDGELSSFTATNSLPDNRNGHGLVCYNNNLIVTGGFDNSGTKQSTVYYSSLNMDGSCTTWNISTAIPTAISNHGFACNNGLLTVIGGETSLGLNDEVYYANVDDLPALSWNLAVDLLYEARKDGATYTSNGQVIFAGGENISTLPIHNTRYVTLNLTSNKVHHGSFLSNPFLQLGEVRDIIDLSYSITYNPAFNNYNLYYRLATADQQWGSWIDASQNNPEIIGQTQQYLQYLITYDGTDDDNVILHDMTINIDGYTQLSGSLNGIDTLKLTESPYWVTGDISFTGGTHVVEAGVNILFSPNTGLEIGQANMNFDGTAADPIVLTSYSDEQGVWNGLHFNTNSDNGVASTLNYVTIEKAGNGTRNANLYCTNTDEPQILYCTINLADGHGLVLNNSDLSIDQSVFSQNTENGIYLINSNPSLSNSDFTSNGIAGIKIVDLVSVPNYFNCNIYNNLYGIYYPSPNFSFPVVTGVNNYTNTVSGIAMDGGDITSDQTWPYNSLGYAVLGGIKIVKQNSKVRLTIAPGNTIYFDSLAQLQVGNYIHYLNEYGGELFANGTADSLITFTSINGLPGGWPGIYFHYNSDSFGSVSELTNCVIEKGNNYNIFIDGSIQPRIDSCTINNSIQYDILVNDPNSVPHITNSITEVFINGGVQSIDKMSSPKISLQVKK
ncbi:MAG: hypothetical protein K9H58_16435 [Bacteroidales bacterium]|nr:hypothetical protein [Bacteroidales bacterium]